MKNPPVDVERVIVKKFLLRLAPFLAILYVFCLIDRSNVSLAALSMQPDLHFSDRVYGFGAGIFFLGYFLFEVPSNLILERVGARMWIARIMLTWGAISAAMMFVKSPISFYTMRFLLGIAEAGFFPGVVLYITYWVPATSRAWAMSRFLALTAILGLFGPFLGGLLLEMNGMLGLAGWQWLFLLEGLPSIALALVVLGVLPDRPADAKWLTDDEKRWLDTRLEAETKHEHAVQHLTIWTALSEWRILHLCLIFIISSTAGNAVGFFGPKLIKERSGGLWSDSNISYVMVIPAIVGAISMSLAAAHSDRTGRRQQHVLVGYLIAALGFLFCVYAPGPGTTVAALALNTLGERIGAGSYWALTTNLLGARAAAGGIAMINSIGNLGGFFGPYFNGWLIQVTGSYRGGLFTAVGLMVVAAILAALLRRQPVYERPVEAPPRDEDHLMRPAGAQRPIDNPSVDTTLVNDDEP